MDTSGYFNCINESFKDLEEGIYGTENAHYINSRIQELSFYCKRLSTPQIGYMINVSVKYLQSKECFLNLGIWEGYSFFAAGVDNEEKIVIGVDNFSEMNEDKGTIANNIPRKYGKTRSNFYFAYEHLKNDNLHFHEKDWIEFLDYFPKLYPDVKIGSVFYDANHTLNAHSLFFQKITPLLSDHCVIFIDDLRYDFVRQATENFLDTNSDFQKRINIEVVHPRHPAWWAGFQVISRQRKR